MQKSKLSIVLVIVLFVFYMVGVVAGVAAEDLLTNTPAPETTAVVGVPPVASDVPAEVTLEPSPTPVPEEKSLFSAATLGELALMLGLAGLAGGGIVAIVLSFLGKKEVRDRVEDARNSWSPEQQAMLTNFTSLFERTSAGIIDFLKAVQDGRPNSDVVAQVLASPQLQAGVKNLTNKAIDDAGVGIQG